MEKTDFTEMDITRAIRYIALPSIVGMVFTTMYNVVDMFWVGTLGYQQIAAVGLFGIFFEFAIIFNEVVGTGSMALIARHYGARNYEKVNDVVKQTLFLKLFVAIIFCCVGVFFVEYILIALGAQGDTIQYGISYGSIMSFGFLFMLSGLTLFTAMRGVGDAKTPMKIMIMTNLLNMVLDPLFIFVLNLGIAGAAAASVVSQMVAFGVGIFLVTTGKHIIHIDTAVRFDFNIMKTMLAIGIPTGAETFIRNIANMVSIRIIAGFGMTAVAGFQIFVRLVGIAVIPLFGLVLASATLVGHNLGAGKPQQAEKTALKASYMGALTMVVVAVVYFVFSEWLVSFFSDTEEVIKVGSSAFRMISPFMVFAGLYYPLNGAFFGSGDTKPPMVITFLSTFCFQIPVMIIASQVMGENGVFLGFGSAFLVGFCIMIVWFFRGTWKQKKLE